MSAPFQILRLFIDNPRPRVVIESIQHRGREVEACAIQEIGAAPDGVRLRITAHDAEGNLRRISLRADARTTNGYQHIGWNQVHRNLTLLV